MVSRLFEFILYGLYHMVNHHEKDAIWEKILLTEPRHVIAIPVDFHVFWGLFFTDWIPWDSSP